jgi:hypothetical protein
VENTAVRLIIDFPDLTQKVENYKQKVMTSELSTPKITFAVVGEHVGKHAFIQRFVAPQNYIHDKYKWGHGQPPFREISWINAKNRNKWVKIFLQSIDAEFNWPSSQQTNKFTFIVIMYDVCNRTSFDYIRDELLGSIRQAYEWKDADYDYNRKCILVGHKCDVDDNDEEQKYDEFEEEKQEIVHNMNDETSTNDSNNNNNNNNTDIITINDISLVDNNPLIANEEEENAYNHHNYDSKIVHIESKIVQILKESNHEHEHEPRREVSYDEGQEFASKNGWPFYDSSDKMNINVEDVFIDASKVFFVLFYFIFYSDKKKLFLFLCLCFLVGFV